MKNSHKIYCYLNLTNYYLLFILKINDAIYINILTYSKATSKAMEKCANFTLYNHIFSLLDYLCSIELIGILKFK